MFVFGVLKSCTLRDRLFASSRGARPAMPADTPSPSSVFDKSTSHYTLFKESS